MALLYAGISERNLRHDNQDSLLLSVREIGGSKTLFAAVCDGVGGLSGGGFASSYIIGALQKWFERLPCDVCAWELLKAEIGVRNQALFTWAQEKGLRVGTTLSALLLCPDSYHIIHTGDSRIYAMTDKGLLTLLTQDDVNEESDTEGGTYSALTACLGAYSEVEPQHISGTPRNDHIFLLCSDGLHKKCDFNLWLPEIARLRSKDAAEKLLRKLVGHVQERGERDNISIALIRQKID